MDYGHRYGVDHGVAFHVENKLRSVLWGWMGQELNAQEREDIARVRDDQDLTSRLADLITADELVAFRARCDTLLDESVMPAPSGDWPAIPWPAFYKIGRESVRERGWPAVENSRGPVA